MTETVAKREIVVQAIKGGKGSITIVVPECLEIITDPVLTPREGCGVIRVMTPQDGDARVVWNSNSLGEIEEAKNMFNKLIAEGLVPYRVGVNGKATAEVMAEFDHYAEEIIFLPIPLVVGG